MVRALIWILATVSAANVEVLKADNFDAFINDTERVLVMFFAPWCGHCKKMEPEFDSAAVAMKEEGLKSRLAKVDATEEKTLATQYGVSGYPTLKYFVKGQASDYEGPREEKGIVPWIRSRELPTLISITADEVDQKQVDRSTDFVVIGRFKENSVRYKVLHSAAEKLRDAEKSAAYRFYYVPLEKGKDPKKDASMDMFNHKTNTTIKYEIAWTNEKAFKWVVDSAYGVVSQYNEEVHTASFMEELYYRNIFIAIYQTDEEKKTLLDELAVLASKHANYKFCYAALDDVNENWSAKQSSVVVLQSEKRYMQVGLQNLDGFIEDLNNNKVKRHFKSADGPEEENGVRVLTGKTFAAIALDSKKDVFVEFYAPWCGHCKALTPIWEELAKKVKSAGFGDKVVIAKFDATANECEEDVGSFPTLFFYPAAKRSFLQKEKFDGTRELEPLFDFLTEKSVHMEGMEEEKKSTKKKFSMIERELQKRREKAQEL